MAELYSSEKIKGYGHEEGRYKCWRWIMERIWIKGDLIALYDLLDKTDSLAGPPNKYFTFFPQH
jgi:hypothetical protein